MVNPPPTGVGAAEYSGDLQKFLSRFVHHTPLSELLPPAETTGNMRFHRPTFYVFPAGDGDSALFGVDGFLTMIDGGYQRRSQVWPFIRYFDAVDAVSIIFLV